MQQYFIMHDCPVVCAASLISLIYLATAFSVAVAVDIIIIN